MDEGAELILKAIEGDPEGLLWLAAMSGEGTAPENGLADENGALLQDELCRYLTDEEG